MLTKKNGCLVLVNKLNQGETVIKSQDWTTSHLVWLLLKVRAYQSERYTKEGDVGIPTAKQHLMQTVNIL